MSKPINPIERFFIRYNFVAMVIVAAATIGISIFLSYNTYIAASTPDESSSRSQIPTSFDATTVKHINALHTSDNPPAVTPPEGRSNPFAE